MIGIVTFHASHNHGSMLQAYATQQTLSKMSYESEIINFRMKSQKEYYALYQTKYGAMRFFRGLLLLPIHRARMEREKKFERFLNSRYRLSPEELHTYTDLQSVKDRYDIFLSGSDQIWSNRIPELVGSDVDYSGVYFLDFTPDNAKRVAYASSIGEATAEDLKSKLQLLDRFADISTREKYGADILEKVTGRNIKTVVDPTFLLNGDQWRQVATKERPIRNRYLFLYTLKGIRPGQKWAKALTNFAKKHELEVVCVSPFFPIVYPKVKCLVNVGPEDFLSLIDHADLVFTDSFHGTAFSINLNKPFYSMTASDSKDQRKTGFLRELGLGNRVLTNFESIANIDDYRLDYSGVNRILKEKRYNSIQYLKSALCSKKYT